MVERRTPHPMFRRALLSALSQVCRSAPLLRHLLPLPPTTTTGRVGHQCWPFAVSFLLAAPPPPPPPTLPPHPVPPHTHTKGPTHHKQGCRSFVSSYCEGSAVALLLPIPSHVPHCHPFVGGVTPAQTYIFSVSIFFPACSLCIIYKPW